MSVCSLRLMRTRGAPARAEGGVGVVVWVCGGTGMGRSHSSGDRERCWVERLRGQTQPWAD
jgi:hypothetical protein